MEMTHHIEKVPGRCGGRAVIVGSRIRVVVILRWYRQGLSVEEIVQHYPQLTPADVHAALAYAYDNPIEMESDLADDDQTAAQKQFPGGPGEQVVL